MLRQSKSSWVQGARHRFHPAFVLWLTIMWCLLQGEFTVANLVGGVAVALAATMLLPLPAMPLGDISISWWPLLRFIGSWLKDFSYASLKVAWLSVRPAAPPKTAILTVPMRVESEFVLALAVLAYNLQPGGAVTDIDIANRMLTVHVLDADTEADIEREIRAVAALEKAFITIFERSVP